MQIAVGEANIEQNIILNSENHHGPMYTVEDSPIFIRAIQSLVFSKNIYSYGNSPVSIYLNLIGSTSSIIQQNTVLFLFLISTSI